MELIYREKAEKDELYLNLDEVNTVVKMIHCSDRELLATYNKKDLSEYKDWIKRLHEVLKYDRNTPIYLYAMVGDAMDRLERLLKE